MNFKALATSVLGGAHAAQSANPSLRELRTAATAAHRVADAATSFDPAPARFRPQDMAGPWNMVKRRGGID